MKIALPKNGEMVNPHFGQSKEFLVVEIENNKIVNQKLLSSESLQHNHAGLSNLFLSEGVSLIITGGIGQPAVNALKEKGLEVIRGATGRCEDVLQSYLSGELVDKNVTCNHVGGHHHHH